MAKIAILGAGGWALALGISAHSSGNDVVMWSPFAQEVEGLLKNRGNERLLPGVTLPPEIAVTTDMACVSGAQLTIVAVPSTAVRQVARQLAAFRDFGIVVNVAKGIEPDTFLRLSQVLQEELPQAQIAVLSGPSHAEEVARGILTSVVAVSESRAAAGIVQDILTTDRLRIYTSEDVVGVELGGALKNVIAVCAGFCDGIGLGDNSKAALITRGLAEMARLGVCMGARENTFAGLAGIGDLVVTCTSRHSRNNRFGNLVGSGTPVAEALQTVGTVEGYHAAKTAKRLAEKYHIEMPIIESCYAVLYEGKSVAEMAQDLMSRPKRAEY